MEMLRNAQRYCWLSVGQHPPPEKKMHNRTEYPFDVLLLLRIVELQLRPRLTRKQNIVTCLLDMLLVRLCRLWVVTLCNSSSRRFNSSPSEQSGAIQIELECTLLSVAFANLLSGGSRDSCGVLTIAPLFSGRWGWVSLPLAVPTALLLLLIPDLGIAHALLKRCMVLLAIYDIMHRNILSLVGVLVEAYQTRHARLGSKVMTSLAFFLLAMDGIANIKHFAQIDSTWRTEVITSVSIHNLGCIEGPQHTIRVLPLVSWRGTRASNPGMREELCDRVALLGIDAQKMRDKILGGFADIVPPWRKEGILALGNLLRQDLNALIVERWEAAKKSVENATQRPHIDGLGVPLILDDLGCCIPDSAAGSHGLFVPDDLG